MQELRLSDQAIAQIVQLIQMGILTGTDISDQIRTLKLVVNSENDTLDPSPNFLEIFNENIAKLAEQADASTQDA